MLGKGPHDGGCACGKVRYVLRDTGGMQPYACHCRDCQTRSGSAFTVQMFVPKDSLKIDGYLAETEEEIHFQSMILKEWWHRYESRKHR